MKRLFTALLLIVALAAAGLGAYALLTSRGAQTVVTIPPGSSAGEIGRLLKREGVIGWPKLFKALAMASGLDRDLKPGSYRLRLGMSSPEALWRLSSQAPEFVKVVIPEGFSARQVAERLEALGVTRAGPFLEYAQLNRLEGYLFPTTYHFSLEMGPAEAAHLMREEFRKSIEPVFSARPAGRLSPDQAVILASIVEREAVLPGERPMIAAVYLNRLARRKPLEADPTVQYAMGYWKKALTREDLRIDSPYNTYRHFGLPPGPICSPSLESVKAVLEPARTDALYFVADAAGGHIFSATYEDHLKAVRRWRREKRLRKASGGG